MTTLDELQRVVERLTTASNEAKAALSPSVRWARASYHDIDCLLSERAELLATVERMRGALELARSLTKVQRTYVADGCIHGDCSMQTAKALMRKGLFHLVIDSPNGQWGFLRLTDLGVAVQAILRANHKDKP